MWEYKNCKLPINVTNKHGCYQAILKPAKEQLDAMLSHYSRVLVFRLDLHVYDYTGSNDKVSKMLRQLKLWLKEKYDMEATGHLWVREVEKAKQQHYHFVIMLNGHKIRYPKKVIEWIESYWTLRNEPKPYTPRECYTMIKRNDQATYNKAFYRLSYLAKERSKGYKDKTANNYSTSRIKPR